MPRTARLSPANRQLLSTALKTYANQRRNSFVVETEIRKLCAFHDSKQNKFCAITVSRQDWTLLAEGRSHMAHTGMCGAHKLVINGQPS